MYGPGTPTMVYRGGAYREECIPTMGTLGGIEGGIVHPACLTGSRGGRYSTPSMPPRLKGRGIVHPACLPGSNKERITGNSSLPGSNKEGITGNNSPPGSNKERITENNSLPGSQRGNNSG